MDETRREVAVLCSYTPVELVEAAGFLPRQVTGLESESPDLDLPANLCPYTRRAAAFLAGPGAAGLAGAVVTDSCSPMLRLWDTFRERTSFPVARLLRVPRLRSDGARAFFRAELAGLYDDLCGASELPPDPERLRPAVAAANESRRLNARLVRLMLEGRRPGLAARLSTIHAGADRVPRGELTARLADCLREAESAEPSPMSRPRLMVAGSFFIHSGLIERLEELGGVVVAVDSCSHDRLGTEAVPERGPDPLGDLASAYLDRPPCPRMRSSREHVASMARLARDSRFDGVVYLLMKCCTPHAYNVPAWRDAMTSVGVPLLTLEVEEDDWSQPRVVTRLEAFLESLRR